VVVTAPRAWEEKAEEKAELAQEKAEEKAPPDENQVYSPILL